MKKRISILLCCAMLLVLTFPMSAFAAEYKDYQTTGTKVRAEYTEKAIDVNQKVTKEVWGEPTISLWAWADHKCAANVSLTNYEGTAKENDRIDVYFRWDNTNLYIAVVDDDDTEKVGSKEAGEWWSGDGVQIRFTVGTTMSYNSGEYTDVGFVLSADKNGTEKSKNISDAKVQFDGNTMHAVAAVPFSVLGITNVTEGTAISFNMIRIDGNNTAPYAGWVSWGTFFGVGSPNNADSTNHNILVLSKETNPVINATKVETAPDITSTAAENWGTKIATVDKNTMGAQLAPHNDLQKLIPEDISMDVYAVWTNADLYLRFVSPDADVQGDGRKWAGDGMQSKFYQACSATSNVLAEACMAFDGNKAGVGTDDNNRIIYEDGKIYIQQKIALATLGIEAKEGSMTYYGIQRRNNLADGANYASSLSFGKVFDDIRAANQLSDSDVVTIKLVNAPAPTPDNPKDPETGDAFDFVLYGALMAASVACIAITLKKKKVADK